jgi:hypothetical protein
MNAMVRGESASLLGIPVVLDDSVEPGVAELRDGERVLAKLENVGKPSTTSALYENGTAIYFNDLIHEGEEVDVFRTEAEAMAGEGWARRMRVRRDGDVWWLEAVT